MTKNNNREWEFLVYIVSIYKNFNNTNKDKKKENMFI